MEYHRYTHTFPRELREKAMRLIFYLWPPTPRELPGEIHFAIIDTAETPGMADLRFPYDVAGCLTYGYDGRAVSSYYRLKKTDAGNWSVPLNWIEKLARASARQLQHSQFCYQLYLEARETAYVGLKIGDLTPLYYGNVYFLGNRFMAHQEIWEEVQLIWEEPGLQWIRKQLQEASQRKAHRPKDVSPAEKNLSQRKAVARSKAIALRVRKYHKLEKQFGASYARKQILKEIEESTRLDATQKPLIRQGFKKKLGKKKG